MWPAPEFVMKGGKRESTPLAVRCPHQHAGCANPRAEVGRQRTRSTARSCRNLLGKRMGPPSPPLPRFGRGRPNGPLWARPPQRQGRLEDKHDASYLGNRRKASDVNVWQARLARTGQHTKQSVEQRIHPQRPIKDEAPTRERWHTAATYARSTSHVRAPRLKRRARP